MLYLVRRKIKHFNEDGSVFWDEELHNCVTDTIGVQEGDVTAYISMAPSGIIQRHQLDGDNHYVTDDPNIHAIEDNRLKPTPYGSVSDIMEMVKDIYYYRGAYFNLSDDGRVINFLHHELCLTDNERMMAHLYAPIITKDNVGKVSVFMNVSDRRRDRRTDIKIGRFVRLIRSAVNDKTVEIISNKFKIKYTPRDFTLHVSSTRPAFRYAYKGVRCTYQDPRTNSTRKSLANSCMHTVSCDSDGTSPAEVYASGDFHIAWVTTLENGKERLGGRVIIRNPVDDNPPIHGPLYGACEASLDKLQEYLDTIGATDDGDWEGAKLLKLHGDRGIIAPYSDMDSCVADYGDFLEFCPYGDYELDSTDGFISHGDFCQHCEERFDYEDEGGYVDGCGPTCQHCLDYHYVWIDEIDSYAHLDTCVEVHYRFGNSTHTEYRLEDSMTFVWSECEGDYWCEDDVSYSDNMNDYVPTHMILAYPDDYPEFYEKEEEKDAA